MWKGKDLKLIVSMFDIQFDEDGRPLTYIDAEDGSMRYIPVDNPKPVKGAEFTLTNVTDGANHKVWTGTSKADGSVTIPWIKVETDTANKASFHKNSAYVLRQTKTNDACVLPAGYWMLEIDERNATSWTKMVPEQEKVNRTLDIEDFEIENGVYAVLGDTFMLYNDRQPKVTYNANGGKLYSNAKDGAGIETRTEDVKFTESELSHNYTIEEKDPTWNTKFLNWATVENPEEGDESVKYYKKNAEIEFYRQTDYDDVTLYAQWVPVKCKITDRDDNLLYIDGNPAIYTTLKDAFDDFNTRKFTLKDSVKDVKPRHIKMLVGQYDMTEPVTLNRGKTAILTTASTEDKDGYPAREGVTICTITRAFGKDENGKDTSMITNKFSLTLKNIILDGAKDQYSVETDGGIVYMEGDYAQLNLGVDATLQNAMVKRADGAMNGNGGAVYAASNTTVNISGGEIIGNEAEDGGAVYVAENGKLDITDGTIGKAGAGNGNVAKNGGGLYLAGTGTFSGGTISNNSANGEEDDNGGGGVYLDGNGALTLSGTAAIDNNASAANGGGVYLNDTSTFAMSGGSITGNNASETNGGAINVGGENAKLFFSGSPLVYNNCINSDGKQKNVVLSVDSNGVINTAAAGLAGGLVGVYVLDGDNKAIYNEHGTVGMPFGTFGDQGHAKPSVFINDRNLALYGVSKSTDDKIYWMDPVCKLTDGNGALLYKEVTITVNGAETKVKVPAVYPKLEGTDAITCGLKAAQGALYPYDSTTPYAGNAVQVKMLCDYELPAGANVTGERAVTLTTAETTVDSKMTAIGDSYTFTVTFTAAQGRLSTDSKSTAIIRRKATLKNASMFATGNAANFTVKDIILDGGSVQTAVNGGIINANAGSLKIQADAVLRNSKTTENGGAVYVDNGATAELTGGEITANSAKDGGAVYVADGGTATLKDGTKTVNGTQTATSVTIGRNTVQTVSGSNVTGSVTANRGAGIYLAEGAKLNMEGSPSFVKGDATNCLTDTTNTYPGAGTAANPKKSNGQDTTAYDEGKVRQDIYLAGSTATIESIVVTGALDVDNGSIWVWPSDSAHYKMLTQFATFGGAAVTETTGEDGTKSYTLNLSGEPLNKTYLAFRNAQDDVTTECGGDYLTGQEGDAKNLIKWTGGFDFVFRKIRPDGEVLTDATFTLYKANNTGTGIATYSPVITGTTDQRVAYRVTSKISGEKDETAAVIKDGKVDARATSGNAHNTAGTAVTIKVKTVAAGVEKAENRVVYGNGLVVFEKIPPGVYFMVEKVRDQTTLAETTGAPAIAGTTVNYEAVEDMYRVCVDPKGWVTIHVANRNATTGAPEWTNCTYADSKITWDPATTKEAPVTAFDKAKDGKYALGLSDSDKATGEEAGTLNVYTVLNKDPRSRKVILRKVDGADYNALGSANTNVSTPTDNQAKFNVYYADKQTVVMIDGKSSTGADIKVPLKDLLSGVSGAFWIGKLPFGTYYLHETAVPISPKTYDKLGTGDNWYILTVNENGVGYLNGSTVKNEINPETVKP